MNKLILFSIAILFFTACGQQGDQDYNSDYVTSSDYEYDNSEDFESQNDKSDDKSELIKKGTDKGSKIIVHKVRDPGTNMISATMPLPANWSVEINSQGSLIKGPNGIKGTEIPNKFFVYSNDSYWQQIYQQSGQAMRRPIDLSNIIIQDIAPSANQKGYTLVKQYEMPELARTDKETDAQFYKVYPTERTFTAMGSEWADKSGNSMLITIRHNISYADGFAYWGYYGNILEAPTKYFESAKMDFVNGLVNARLTKEFLADFNRKEAAKAQKSQADHQLKMQNNQARFDQQQANFRRNSEATNKAIMDNYYNQSAASDRSQDQFIDYIRDETNVYDPNTGQGYKVESGANQYWMNEYGQYIQSDNYNYNPNTDPNANQYNWTKVEENNR